MDRVKVLKSYTKVWRIERVFYQVGGVNLPNPVALNTFLYYCTFAVLMYFLCKVTFLGRFSPITMYFIIPGFLAWFCNNKKLDGKNPLSFLKSVVIHYISNKVYGEKINRFRYIKKQSKLIRFNSKISYRIYNKI